MKKGATLLVGGKPHAKLNAQGGTFFEPTVITNVTRDMLPFTQETFGPLLPLIKFKTEAEAIEMANDTEYVQVLRAMFVASYNTFYQILLFVMCSMGLASYACTRDLGRAWRLSDQLQSGMVGINEGSIGMSFAPFGGIKQSGMGSEGGSYGLNEYLVTKYTCMGHGYAPA